MAAKTLKNHYNWKYCEVLVYFDFCYITVAVVHLFNFKIAD